MRMTTGRCEPSSRNRVTEVEGSPATRFCEQPLRLPPALERQQLVGYLAWRGHVHTWLSRPIVGVSQQQASKDRQGDEADERKSNDAGPERSTGLDGKTAPPVALVRGCCWAVRTSVSRPTC